MKSGNDPILSEIESYLANRGITATAFGSSAVNDPRLVFDLRDGRELRRTTRKKVEDFMRDETSGRAGA